MAKAHRMTSKRKVALRKAQAASARKRKGKGGWRGKARTAMRYAAMAHVASSLAMGAYYGKHSYGQMRKVGVSRKTSVKYAGRWGAEVAGRTATFELHRAIYNRRKRR